MSSFRERSVTAGFASKAISQNLPPKRMDSQPEFFEDLPRCNPGGRFAEVRVDGKVIPIGISVWKGGRMRADLSPCGAGEVVSRNSGLFWERVIRRLKETCKARIVEVVNAEVVEVVSAISGELAVSKSWRSPRLRKKDLAKEIALTIGNAIYANPFVEDRSQLFGKYPDWLLAVSDRELKPQEKLIYARLLFPLPPICRSFRKDTGEIIGLNQGALGKALGMSRPTANHWILCLQAKKCIECLGSQGSRQITRFFWKEWRPETCRTYQHVDGQNMLANPNG